MCHTLAVGEERVTRKEKWRLLESDGRRKSNGLSKAFSQLWHPINHDVTQGSLTLNLRCNKIVCLQCATWLCDSPQQPINCTNNCHGVSLPLLYPLRLIGLAKLSLTRGQRPSPDTANRTKSQLPQPWSVLVNMRIPNSIDTYPLS